MYDLANSIKDNGVLVPAIIRKKDNSRYEMIAGHRRKFASQLADLETSIDMDYINYYNQYTEKLIDVSNGIITYDLIKSHETGEEPIIEN